MTFSPPVPPGPRRHTGRRGSMLLTAMLLAIGLALVLGTYLTLSRTSLKVAQRTFFANDAANLAEAGVEEALYCFKQLSAGTDPATAWSGWTFSAANAMYTLPTFNRDQNGIGVVKVYVKGYDGSDAAPYIVSQAVLTPFDGSAPIIRTVHLALRRQAGTLGHGLVALNGLTMNNSTYADSYASNPTASPTGPWLVYSTAIDQSNASVAVLAGTISMASGARIRGDLFLGSGVTAPPGGRVSGTITSNYSLTVPFPTYPTAAGVSQSYSLGATIPSTLPRAGDLPAADGRYYYFTTASVRNFAVSANSNISMVGTSGMALTSSTEITLPTTSTLHVFVSGAVTLGTGTDMNTSGYAGAMRIYTTTASNCTVANNCRLVAWFHAPNAAFSATGTNTANRLSGCFVARTITVSSTQYLHFDESLPVNATYEMTRYMDFHSAADQATVAGMTENYLR